MNFYNLIKQQYDDYGKKADSYSLTSCKRCPCKTLRDKVFGTDDKPRSCSTEMMNLANKCNIHNNTRIFFCDECRRISVEIAKKLFGKKEFNKI